jgi:hypothetical protein
MVNYTNGKVYKIVSNLTNQIYVGSTTKKYLSQRMNDHRSAFKFYGVKKDKYLTSFVILKFYDAEIVLLENVLCKSKDELRARERHYIETLPNTVNKMHPTRTAQEYEQLPERKAKKQAHAEKLESREKKRAYQSTPEYLAKRREQRRLAKEKK